MSDDGWVNFGAGDEWRLRFGGCDYCSVIYYETDKDWNIIYFLGGGGAKFECGFPERELAFRQAEMEVAKRLL